MRNVTNIEHKIKQLQKKLDILFKKKRTFGLTIEEDKNYREFQTQFYTLHDEYIDIKVENVLLTHLYDKDTTMALKTIQAIVPWSGGFVIRESEFEGILESEITLSKEQKVMIENNLIKIHKEVLNNFEKMTQNEDVLDFLIDMGKFVSQKKDGDIGDLARYIDSRYREFGELLGIELEELEIEWLNL